MLSINKALSGKKILIVEDEQDLLDIFEEFLDDLGALVTKAKNGLEALDYLKTSSFDLVISDIRMPMLDGIGLLKKANETLSQPPMFLFLSGNLTSSNNELMRLGAKDIVCKPFEINKLVELILKYS